MPAIGRPVTRGRRRLALRGSDRRDRRRRRRSGPAPEGHPRCSRCPTADGGRRRAGARSPNGCSSSRPGMIGPVKATAIIPVKRFGQAKQRLLETLDRPQRAALVKAMLTDVLVAVSAAEADRARDRRHRRGAGGADRSPPRAAHHDPARGASGARRTTAIPRPRRWASSGRSRSAPSASRCCRATARCSIRPSSTARSAGWPPAGSRSSRIATAPAPTRCLLAPADAIGPAFGEGSMERHRERAGARRSRGRGRGARVAGARPRHPRGSRGACRGARRAPGARAGDRSRRWEARPAGRPLTMPPRLELHRAAGPARGHRGRRARGR